MTNTLSAEQEKMKLPPNWEKAQKIFNPHGRYDICALCGFSPEGMREEILASNQRVRRQTLQEVQGLIEWELKSELLKRMMHYDSKDGYSQIHDEIIQKVYEDVETILLSFRKKKLSALIEKEK